ncbi:MAG: PHP domain-containing protein [Solobacterium sp.]|nr:PHP domain-containing protein [Solobacterium sp.]
MPRKIDLHMHSTVSDGTDTPEGILSRVRQEGLEMFALTDHDAIKGCGIIRSCLREGDPFFLNGAEFSCQDDEGKYHILGYGYDADSEAIKHVIELGHSYRMNKVRRRLDFLRDRFGFTFPEDELDKLLAMDNPGKPHIGNLMVRLGFAKTKEEAIKDYINQIRFRSEYVKPQEAIEGILGAGGIPVLAHPVYGSGDQLILNENMDYRLRRLTGFGLQGVEAYYSGFTPKMTNMMLGFAERYDLYVTAGSDYHGKNKMIALGENGLDEVDEFPEGLMRFLKDTGALDR